MADISADGFPVERTQRYTTVAIILHWLIAVAILFQMAGGKWMVSAGAEATASVFAVFQIHKTVGLTILALTLARIIWRLAHPAPALPEGMTGFERTVSSVSHFSFYMLLLLIPLSGWAMASVSPTGVPTFFLMLEALPFAHLPLFGGASLTELHNIEGVLKNAHNYLSMAMGALVLLHVAAALKHQFVAQDNLLARMVVSAKSVPSVASRAGMGGLAGLAGAAFIVGGIGWGIAQKTTPATAVLDTDVLVGGQTGEWTIDHDQSSLGFTITFTGNPVVSTIGAWDASITFDPDALEEASANVSIDMTSVSLGDATLQAQSGGGDGFDLTNFPTATYETTGFTQNEDGTFLADGTLSLRGMNAQVPLTFTFDEDGDRVARVSGSATLNRLDFEVGAVGAANEAWILYEVTVAFDLVATR
ncbi:MAG: cytochrome b/b6 domain-containing protein [Pseudomonadota bacterium]